MVGRTVWHGRVDAVIFLLGLLRDVEARLDRQNHARRADGWTLRPQRTILHSTDGRYEPCYLLIVAIPDRLLRVLRADNRVSSPDQHIGATRIQFLRPWELHHAVREALGGRG